MAAVPVADAFSTRWTGTPVMPISLTARTPAIAGMKRCPTYTASMSFMLTPASSSAASPASRPMMV